MFSLKNQSQTNPTNINPNTALPNNHGKIRTMKEDYENFRSGKKEVDEETEKEILESAASATARPVPKEKPAEPAAFSPPESKIPPVPPAKNPNHEIPSPFKKQPPAPAAVPPPSPRLPKMQESLAENKKEAPASHGTSSYFSEKSPFEEVNRASQAGSAEAKPAKKSSTLAVAIVFSLLVLAILGGGFYYYWFYIKKSPLPETPTATQTQTSAPTESQTGKSVRTLPTDPAAGASEFQASFQKMAADFFSDASNDALVEIRPVGKDEKQIPTKEFAALSFPEFPETITQKFSSDDYSLFLQKENGEVRAGLVVKLAESSGIAEELTQEEKNLPNRLSFLYLDQKPGEAEPVFNFSKYKSADIRYYNFPSPPNTSIDYSVIAGKDASYLIFATSKDAMRSILDYMSEK